MAEGLGCFGVGWESTYFLPKCDRMDTPNRDPFQSFVTLFCLLAPRKFLSETSFRPKISLSPLLLW